MEVEVFKVILGYSCVMSLRPAWIRHTHTLEESFPSGPLNTWLHCFFLPFNGWHFAEALLYHGLALTDTGLVVTPGNHFHVAKVKRMVSIKIAGNADFSIHLMLIVAFVFKSKSSQHSAHFNEEKLTFSRGYPFPV